MLQYFAQGACMALEDAVCLGHQVNRNPDDIPAALDCYQRQRRVRTARVQLDSRLIGDYIYHAEGAVAELRDHLMRPMSPQQWYDRLDWLYAGNGLQP